MIAPRKVDKHLVLYGKGNLGLLSAEIFKKLNISFDHIDHKDNLEEWWLKESSLVAVCIASEPFSPVKKYLCDAGYDDVVPVYDIIEAYPEIHISNGWLAGNLSDEDILGIACVYEHLDIDSNIHYGTMIRWRCDRIESPCNIIPITADSLPSTLADIRARQRVDMFADAPTNGIVIHNEGCELKTIEENIGIFQKHRPLLKVACYHSRDGLWKIEKFLMDSLEDYKWTFRLHAWMGQAAYIYGIPKERR